MRIFRTSALPRLVSTALAGLLFVSVVGACGDDDAPSDGAPAGDDASATVDTPEDSVAPPETIAADPSARPDQALEPRPFEESVEVDAGITVRVVDIVAVDTEATAPFERSGPGVVVTIEVANDSPEPLDLSGVIVDLVDAEGAPAGIISDPANLPLPERVEAGAVVTGSYVFTVAAQARHHVEITVTYPEASNVVTAVFTGTAPGV